jgi:hypothetical protein
MDQVIYEDFKGTGNSELVLSAKWPSGGSSPHGLQASGTRREELLLPPALLTATRAARPRARLPTITAMEQTLGLLKRTKSNDKSAPGEPVDGMTETQEPLTEHHAAAVTAGLVLRQRLDPGIRRRKSGKGFQLHRCRRPAARQGAAEADSRSGHPPAWTDVRVCPDPRGHIRSPPATPRAASSTAITPPTAPSGTKPSSSGCSTSAKSCPASGPRSRRTWPSRAIRAKRSWPRWCGCWKRP